MKKIILTGDRPTGKLHLGHYLGSLLNRVKLQDKYDEFIMIADAQALTDNANKPQKVRDNILEVALDNLACGLNQKKVTIFIQSMVPEITELFMYFLNLVTLARLQRNPTVRLEMKQKSFTANVPVGFLVYPISQAADILAFKPALVPVGEDQLPMIEQTNEIAEKFNKTYGKIFHKIEALVPKFSRLPGIDGKNKMSKSLNNAIYLADSYEEIKKKVMSMYTDPNHIHVNDPGKVEDNIVFIYLDIFDPDKKQLEKIKEHYRRGGVGDIAIKERLINILEKLIKPIRERRKKLAESPKEILKILKNGTAKAREIADKTLTEVKQVMKINYF